MVRRDNAREKSINLQLAGRYGKDAPLLFNDGSARAGRIRSAASTLLHSVTIRLSRERDIVAYHVATIIGARPQFIKAAALSRALLAADGFKETLIHTGQHFDDNMSDIFFRELEIPTPAHNLGIHGGPHGEMTGQMLAGIERILTELAPDVVLIYGDTNSTLAGAIAAAKLHIPVAHVEAGLRSFNRRMPEEVNRVLADHVSSLLLCPTQAAVENLRREGIIDGVVHSGDVMFDATLYAREKAGSASRILETLKLLPGRYGVCTIHRSENTDNRGRLARIVAYVQHAAGGEPVVFPVHPRTRNALARYGIEPKTLVMIDPVGYFDLHRLLGGAKIVLTDSGGLQKEAYFHRVPCVTLRDETEWEETIATGWNRLWTTPYFASPQREIADFGDGHAAERIVEQIRAFLRARLSTS